MLRNLRRRFGSRRGEPLAHFTFKVVAVSPHPEEPEDEENYRPPLIVQSSPEPADTALTPDQLAIITLLFVNWTQERLGDAALPQRLKLILPRLRLALKQERLGPDRYAQHRATQQERYYLHREAAAHDVTLYRDDAGLFVGVKSRVAEGRWTEANTLLEAGSVALYEALLRLDPTTSQAALAWLEQTVERWFAGEEPDFPLTAWAQGEPFAPPNDPQVQDQNLPLS